MAVYENPTQRDHEAYGPEFDRVMVFESDYELPLIQLAARAHARFLTARGQVPSGFYEGVQSLDPRTPSLMMNQSYANDYGGMLASYVREAFLFVDHQEGVDFDEHRQRARQLEEDIVQGARAFEVFGAVDLKAVSAMPAPFLPLTVARTPTEEKPVLAVPTPRLPAETEQQPKPNSLATRFWQSGWGRALFHVCDTRPAA